MNLLSMFEMILLHRIRKKLIKTNFNYILYSLQGEKIRSEKSSVAAGTRSLAFDHYRTFIATSGKKVLLIIFNVLCNDFLKNKIICRLWKGCCCSPQIKSRTC